MKPGEIWTSICGNVFILTTPEGLKGLEHCIIFPVVPSGYFHSPNVFTWGEDVICYDSEQMAMCSDLGSFIYSLDKRGIKELLGAYFFWMENIHRGGHLEVEIKFRPLQDHFEKWWSDGLGDLYLNEGYD